MTGCLLCNWDRCDECDPPPAASASDGQIRREEPPSDLPVGSKTDEDETAENLWTIAAERFAASPYSNGNDGRYETVKAELRAKFGHEAIHSSNKQRLKALAKAHGVSDQTRSRWII